MGELNGIGEIRKLKKKVRMIKMDIEMKSRDSEASSVLQMKNRVAVTLTSRKRLSEPNTDYRMSVQFYKLTCKLKKCCGKTNV